MKASSRQMKTQSKEMKSNKQIISKEEIPKRHNNKWSINETLSLQREYQLLGMSIDEIAKKHQRCNKAIRCKLEMEMEEMEI